MKRSWQFFTPEQWQICIWALSACALLSANTYYFPLSVFSKLLSPPIPEFFILIHMYLSLVALGILILNALLFKKNIRILLFIAPFILGFSLFPYFEKPGANFVNKKPNIIMLGIDSLSPESINKENMPSLHKLLTHSTQFTNAISPIARTYPAWSSILTGLYPEHHFAEENLFPKHLINSQASIAWTLDKLGYNTIYSTDDRRFNSIGKEFGFKKIIGPELGVNDILLGSFNDFPLSNLIINSSISAWFFPFNYINRASYFSYYPETFSNKLENELSRLKQNKPVFLAVHFTLPHWPYAWAESSPKELDNEFSINQRETLYQAALKRVDKQFHSFFNYLKRNQYLTNSLVIILSDHGEVLYYPNSRLTNYRNYQETLPSPFAQYIKTHTATVLNKSAGHGSDILSPKQYHSVLAFNIYQKGKSITQNNKVISRVALIDLAPTILAFLNQSIPQAMDGISLLPALLNSQENLPKRIFFIASGMFPNQIISKEKAMEIGGKFYEVNPINGELEIKLDKLKYFDNQRLYGVIQGDWVLALYPDNLVYIPVIQNLTNGKWSDNLQGAFAKKTPADALYTVLKRFYGKKIHMPLLHEPVN